MRYLPFFLPVMLIGCSSQPLSGNVVLAKNSIASIEYAYTLMQGDIEAYQKSLEESAAAIEGYLDTDINSDFAQLLQSTHKTEVFIGDWLKCENPSHAPEVREVCKNGVEIQMIEGDPKLYEVIPEGRAVTRDEFLSLAEPIVQQQIAGLKQMTN